MRIRTLASRFAFLRQNGRMQLKRTVRLMLERAKGLPARSKGSRDQWLREVMLADTEREFRELDPAGLDVVEVTGALWADWPWRSRTQFDFPDFDLCAPPDQLPGPFDLVICEQVLEHVPDPITAVDTLRRLTKPGGLVYISTPFLIRLHPQPGDYWRFTPSGLETLLRFKGLEPLWVRSWGNRQAVVANFDAWRVRGHRSLRNEPHLPAVVWSLARRD